MISLGLNELPHMTFWKVKSQENAGIQINSGFNSHWSLSYRAITDGFKYKLIEAEWRVYVSVN